MPTNKFDETDRRAVVEAVSRTLGVCLERVGSRRKWFQDEKHRRYWVVGGYGQWHGIPEEMMDAEVSFPSGGRLVFAARQRPAIEIFIGPLAPLAAERTKLYRASQTTGDYQFTFKKRGGHVFVEQAPRVVLTELARFKFDHSQKDSLWRAREFERLIAGLSEHEREELLKELVKGNA